MRKSNHFQYSNSSILKTARSTSKGFDVSATPMRRPGLCTSEVQPQVEDETVARIDGVPSIKRKEAPSGSASCNRTSCKRLPTNSRCSVTLALLNW